MLLFIAVIVGLRILIRNYFKDKKLCRGVLGRGGLTNDIKYSP
jgi:hypothetical protein